MPIRYTRVGWQDAPSTDTPVNAANLNHMDNGILAISQELDTELDAIRDEFDALEQDTSSQIDSFKEETATQISKFSSDITTMQNGLPGMISDKMDDKYGQEIGDNVTSWLTEHVNPAGSAVVVDDTLTIQGGAADAKKTGDEISGLKEDYSDILNSAYVTDTASGLIASFPDGADDVPVKSLKVNIDPVQEGSGDPSPDNVRPISGYTSAKVTRTGKNLFDASMLLDGTGWTESNGVYSGSTADLENKYPNTLPISVLPYNGQLTLSCDYYNSLSSRWGYIFFHYTDGTNNYYQLNASSWTHLTATSAQGKTVERIRIVNSNTQTGYLRNIQLEFGASATAYEPYNGQEVTIDLDGTIYGGSLDAATGKMMATKTILSRLVSDMGNSENYPGWTNCTELENVSGVTIGNNGTLDNMIGNVGNKFSYNTSSNKRVVYLPIANYGMTQTEWKSSYPNLEVQFILPLATPFEVTLTPQEVTTLLGQNNIWADTGDIEVEYRADTKLYIEKLTAPTEDDLIADHAISANSFFMVGNTLYRATTAIASGATITVGTNATKMSLSDALNALA